VRVVTFDLDDTLWPTTGVVLGANTVLQSWFESNYPEMHFDSGELQVITVVLDELMH
jgi:FMN phosphatase YigB (HAD superfamily)